MDGELINYSMQHNLEKEPKLAMAFLKKCAPTIKCSSETGLIFEMTMLFYLVYITRLSLGVLCLV